MLSAKRTAGPYPWLPAMIAVVILAGLAIAGVGLWSLRERLIESTGRTLALTAAESVDKLALILSEHARRLRIVSEDPALSSDDAGQAAVRLQAFAADHPEYRWVAVTDLAGRVTASSDLSRVGTVANPRPWFAIARGVGIDVRTVRVGDDSARRSPVLAFTVPLVDADGAVRGVLVAHGTLSHVKRVFDRSTRELQRKWSRAMAFDWHLLSPNGDLIASTRRRPLLPKLALPSAFASAGSAPGYLEERDPGRGVGMLTGYARMRGHDALALPRWALLIHVDRQDVVGPIHQMILKLGALWALVMAPLFLTTIWATGRLREEWSESREDSRRASEARRAADESEGRMRAILDHAAEGIVTVDDTGIIRSFNTAAVRMFGWTAGEICGQSVARLLPSGATGMHDLGGPRWLERIVRRNNDRTVTLTGRRRSGATFPLGLALSEVVTDDHRVFIGIVRDLTDQKRAEADRGLLASIIEHTDDFVGVASLDGRVVFVNPAGRRLVGVEPYATVGDVSLDDFVYPDDRPAFREHIVPAVIRNGRWQGELRGRHLATGEPLDVGVNLFLVHHPRTGRASGFAAVCRDLREQKRVEEATRQARELTLAKEMAEAASRAKSDFLATMSHEIRTPLNGVVGMTALLLDTRLTEEQRDYAESLRTCSASLLSVIDDVLDFSKMEAGKLDLEVIDFDLRRTVEEVVELFAERAHSKHLELAALIDPAIATALRGDPNRLRQILSNLIGNALKFTDHGEVVVRVSAVGDGPSSVLLHLAVADTGIGIPPERQAMIFESFSQSDVSNARVYGGSGLGLAIVKRLAELMGGQIVVDSEPGAGSTFTLVVRLEKQPGAVARASVPILQGRRVLIVDDSPTVRALLRAYLRRLGIRCGATEDGAHALALLRAAATRRKPYDVVLLDWDMPVMDGLEVAQAIAQEPTIADVRMVLLTAIGQRRAARRASRKTGIAAFLSKPLRLDRLESCLLNLFDAPTPKVAQRARPDERVAQRTIPVLGHVLVAEDDPVSQKVARRLLEKRGYRVDVVGNGRSAVDACLRRAYDLLLMDCRLPDLDGFEATREIRRRESSQRRTPIVALTASAAPTLQQRCLDAGMSGHLAKPLRTEALDAVLREWVEPRGEVASATDGDELLDTAGLLARVDGDLDFVRELALGLRDDRPRWLDELHGGLAAHDAARVEHAAHAICGSAGNLGGRRVAALAREIETRAHAGDLAPCGPMLPMLAGALEQLERALLGLDRRHLAAS